MGASKISQVQAHAFLYEQGQMIDLGTLGGTISSAQDINDVGQIVGGSATATDDHHAFLYDVVKGAQYNKTGQVIHDLAALADRYTDMTKKHESLEGRIKHVVNYMGVTRESLQRLIGKLHQLKQTKYMKNIVEDRLNLSTEFSES